MGAWSVRRYQPLALSYVLVTNLCAAAVVIVVIGSTPVPNPRQLGVFSMIALTGAAVIIATSISIHVRQEVRRNPWTIHITYLVAGVLLLPPNLLVLLLLGPALHATLSIRPEKQGCLFITSATVLPTFAARAVIGWHTPRWDAVSMILAATVLLLFRAALVAVGLRLQTPRTSWQSVLGSPTDVVLGIVGANLGGLLAMAVATEPFSALLAAPPMALLDLATQLPQWRRSAQVDAKTGLSNAMHWDRRARSELERAKARSQSMAVLLVDLDRFKRINDEIGHLAGDAVLSAVALMLRSSVRREDVVGRFGGEEFVVLLPGADPEIACTVAQRVRMSIASLSVPARDTNGEYREVTGLTVSIGVATSMRFGYELADLLVSADSALLAAKSGGRNAVTMA